MIFISANISNWFGSAMKIYVVNAAIFFASTSAILRFDSCVQPAMCGVSITFAE